MKRKVANAIRGTTRKKSTRSPSLSAVLLSREMKLIPMVI
jgi:hypothetical protein